jgi:hypothetical protein
MQARRMIDSAWVAGALAFCCVACGPMEADERGAEVSTEQRSSLEMADSTGVPRLPTPSNPVATTEGQSGIQTTRGAQVLGTGAVSDSQDPIPITTDGRPTAGGNGGGGPAPGGDPTINTSLGASQLRAQARDRPPARR